MKKIIMSLCLLVSCSSFASSHLTHQQVIEYKARLAQVNQDIREIKKEIVSLRNNILTQQLANTEIQPLRNQLNAYEKAVERGNEIIESGEVSQHEWAYIETKSLKYGRENSISYLNFYTDAKTKAYERITKNYVALITYINTKVPSNNASLQGMFHFAVNGVPLLDY